MVRRVAVLCFPLSALQVVVPVAVMAVVVRVVPAVVVLVVVVPPMAVAGVLDRVTRAALAIAVHLVFTLTKVVEVVVPPKLVTQEDSMVRVATA